MKQLTSWLLLAAALTLGGCAKLNLTYEPSTAAAGTATGTAVTLKVHDARPEDRNGGDDGKRVGKLRDGLGIPSNIRNSEPAIAVTLVTDATKDALRQAGVGAEGGTELSATIKEFWMDGYMGYKGTATVEYALKDAQGQVLWSKELTSEAGGSTVFGNPLNTVREIYAKVLAELASKAAQEFATPEFVGATSGQAAAAE